MANKIQLRRGTKAQLATLGALSVAEPGYATDTKELFIGNGSGGNTPVITATTADITYYVRTDGSDSNNGLANTSAGAFKTINYAISVIMQMDNHTVNVNIAAGTYAETVSLKGFSGRGTIALNASGTVNITRLIAQNNTIKITITGITATTTTETAFELDNNTWVWLQNCNATASASTQYGVMVYGGAAVISGGMYSNKTTSIWARSTANVFLVAVGGSGSGYGYLATEGAKIGGNAGGMSATVSISSSQTGGIVALGDGVINPWGDNTTDTRSFIEASPSILQDNIPAVTWTKINFGSKGRDNLGEYNPATSTFTVSKTGIYAISVSVGFGFSSSISVPVRSLVDIYFNGGAARIRFVDTTMANIIGLAANGAQVMRLNAGDTMNVYAYCSVIFGVSSDWQITNLRVVRIA